MNLELFIRGQRAGAIALKGGPGPQLMYDDKYKGRTDAVPLSVLAPLGGSGASGEPLRNWLEGLLPDDERLLRALLAHHGLAGRHPVFLLSTLMGLDCAGAVQFVPVEETDRITNRGGGARGVGEEEIASELRRLSTYQTERSWGDGHRDSGYSLAGMQPKVAVAQSDDGWLLPWGDRPTTHIIKATRPDRYPHEAVIEHLTMAAAGRVGIPVAASEVAQFGDAEVIIVRRFDRRIPALGNDDRIHQEDICQAFGLLPHFKYQRDGGPTPRQIAELLRSRDRARADANIGLFADLLLFQWACAASDGHAKNFSLMHLGGSEIRMSPGYDIASWLPYRGELPTAKIKMSMKLGGDYGLRTHSSTRFQKFADDLGLPVRVVTERAQQIAVALPKALEASIEALPPGFEDNPQVAAFLRDAVAWTSEAEASASRELASLP